LLETLVKTVAIFGAGPALGLSVARRFAAEGFRVALVARRRENLDALTAELTADVPGVEVATVVADVLDRAQLADAVTAIENRFGHVDVAVYSPNGLDQPRVGILDVDPDGLPTQLELLLLAPIALTRLVLPGMRERGDGALLFASGTSAIEPVAQLGNVGIALAGMRNYVHNLNGAVSADGVYAGVVPIGGLIKRSAVEALLASSAGAEQFGDFDAGDLRLAVLDPDEIADVFWDLYVKRDRHEQVVTELAAR
jgi:NADP-dependent 3-hydroxy acid dehydrogenase YdfG